jgi:hypothetical protein
MMLEHKDNVEQWGYAFVQNVHSNGNGDHPHMMYELWFILREEPTDLHYDPQSARLWLISGQNGLERRMLRHPWRGPDKVPAGPGHIQLRDRYGRSVDAFTFGGSLEVVSSPECTRCSLQSPAPIFDLHSSARYSGAKLFCERVDGLLARRKAEWITEPSVFSRKLAETSPLELYLSCLRELLGSGDQPVLSSSFEEHSYHQLLRSEVNQLTSSGIWSEQVPEIASLV